MNRTLVFLSFGVIIGAVGATPAPAFAETNATTAAPSKKQAWLAEKTARQAAQDEAKKQAFERSLTKRIGAKPKVVVNIFNTWTHETIAIVLDHRAHRGGTSRAKRRIAGAKKTPAEAASWHLRCHFTNEPTAMDARLFQVLVEAAHHFKAPRIEIISGFRAPKYNLTLRKKGRQVARNSHHTLGEAVDFRLPGISTSKLRKWARALKLGGVGYYPSSGFVHVDVGKVRTWRGD